MGELTVDTGRSDTVIGQRIILTLTPLADERPLAVRLRQLLKTALRRDRLKCLSVEGVVLDHQQDKGEER
jgi:hypothetical protein